MQDSQDIFLEQQREAMMTDMILVIQKMVLAWHYRSQFIKMRKAIVVMQTNYRMFSERWRFLKVVFGCFLSIATWLHSVVYTCQLVCTIY